MQATQTLYDGRFKELRDKSRKERAPISRHMISLLLAGACAGPVLLANAAEPSPTLAASVSELPRALPEQVGVDSRQLVRLADCRHSDS